MMHSTGHKVVQQDVDEETGNSLEELYLNDDDASRNRLSQEADRQSRHPVGVITYVDFTERNSYVTRSLGHGVRQRIESNRRSQSFPQEELNILMKPEGSRMPQIQPSSLGSTKDIEDFLPSRLAASSGTRTVAIRRTRSRSRRSLKIRTKDEEVPLEVMSGQVQVDVVEDVVDYSGQRMEMEEEDAEGMLSTIKLRATTMENKRKLRRDLLEKTTKLQRGIGYKTWWTKANTAWTRHGRYAKNVSQSFKIWESSFKSIEGTFGASVLSYFLFLRLLFYMDLFKTLIILATIIVPQIVIFSLDFISSNCHNISVVDNFFLNESCNLSTLYHEYLHSVQGNSSSGQMVVDFFMGTGWMENSIVFFGFYSNEGLSVKNYSMALSYLLTTGFYLAAILLFMVLYSGNGLKDRMLQSSDRPVNVFERVFCGWDYSLVEVTSAKEKHKAVYQELNMIYNEWKRRQEKQVLNFVDKCRLHTRRIFGHILVILMLVGAGAAIAVTIIKATPVLESKKIVQEHKFLNLVISFLPSIILTLLNYIFPAIFRLIARMEKYSDEAQLRITLLRTVFLRLASIAVLVITVVVQFNSCHNPPCQLPHTTLVTYCWETYMGQQLYRLVILDFIVVLAFIFFYDFPLNLMSKRFPRICLFGKREFDVSQNVIDITYTQALCWIGAFFSPLIPAITMLKMVIFFFAKKFTLMKNYRPKPTRASETTYLFMVIVMIAFVLCSAAIAYSVARLPPSKSCGPFRVYAEEKFFMFNALAVAIKSLPVEAQKVFSVVGSWIFYLGLVIASSLLILWRSLKAYAHREFVVFLKARLKTERADKEFLLARVRAMTEANSGARLRS